MRRGASYGPRVGCAGLVGEGWDLQLNREGEQGLVPRCTMATCAPAAISGPDRRKAGAARGGGRPASRPSCGARGFATGALALAKCQCRKPRSW